MGATVKDSTLLSSSHVTCSHLNVSGERALPQQQVRLYDILGGFYILWHCSDVYGMLECEAADEPGGWGILFGVHETSTKHHTLSAELITQLQLAARPRH